MFLRGGPMKLINLKDAVSFLDVSDRTIRNWIDDGKIQKYEDEKGNLMFDKQALLRMKPTVITFFNQKGGCGKTTSSVILTDYFDKKNDKILLVDFDQQGNLSQTFFMYEELKDSLSLYDYFSNKTPLNKIIKKYNENIDVLTSNIKLARTDTIDTSVLVKMKQDFITLFKKYSIVIIDCPPSLNSFSRFGVLLANYIFCPVIPEPYSYDGLDEVLTSISDLVEFNKDFIDYKAFISSHKQIKTLIRENYISLLKNELGDKLFNATVPEFVGIVERSMSKTNIFAMYENDKQINRVYELSMEMDDYIFDGRALK